MGGGRKGVVVGQLNEELFCGFPNQNLRCRVEHVDKNQTQGDKEHDPGWHNILKNIHKQGRIVVFRRNFQIFEIQIQNRTYNFHKISQIERNFVSNCLKPDS